MRLPDSVTAVRSGLLLLRILFLGGCSDVDYTLDYSFSHTESADSSSRSPNEKGHASWDEFAFGLRAEHCEHERDFTPTLYAVHKVLDWNGELQRHIAV